MADSIETFRTIQFANTISLLLQQKGSKLRNLVEIGNYVGKQGSPVEQVGSINARKRTTKGQTLVPSNPPADRRWVYPEDYDLTMHIDSVDKLRMLIAPEGAWTTAGLYAMGRAIDDEIIASFFRDAKTGETGGTTTTFDSNFVVARDHGAASATRLTVPKLREAKRLLMAAEVDLEAETPNIAVTSYEHDSLLAEIQVTSADFNKSDRPVLMDGKITYFMGFQFVHCERLSRDTANSDTEVPVWVKSGMHLGLWNDINADVDMRKDIEGHPWQLYLKGTFGATRVEEKRVVKILCDRP